MTSGAESTGWSRRAGVCSCFLAKEVSPTNKFVGATRPQRRLRRRRTLALLDALFALLTGLLAIPGLLDFLSEGFSRIGS
jgi:hypothetical protein